MSNRRITILLGITAALLLAVPAVATAQPHSDGASLEGERRERPSGHARVVVAAIDSAINPYHEFFHHGGEGPWTDEPPAAVTPQVLRDLGVRRQNIIELTRTGDPEADLKADAEQWARVQRGQPYWFRGTNVIAVSFLPADSSLPPLQPHPDKSPHGLGVTASVAEANPEAVLVLVEGINNASEKWAFTQPAVDIVTTSYGPIGSPPLPWHLDFSFTGVVEKGKLHFGAVDNTPGLSPIDTTGGPWWSIGVAGFQEHRSGGRQAMSGTAPDYVAQFTHKLPYCMICQEGRRVVSGTSFASPRSAGTMSAALLEVRRVARHRGGITTTGVERPLMVDGRRHRFTNWELRRALEEAAVYPGIEDYDPGPYDSVWNVTAVPVPDPAPWTLTGWGMITPEPEHRVVDELLAHLGVAGEPTREKGSAACTYMTAVFEARYHYWNNYAFMGESWQTDEDPYVRC